MASPLLRPLLFFFLASGAGAGAASGEEGVVVLRAGATRTVLIGEGSFTMGTSEEEVARLTEACKREPIRGLTGLPPCAERTFALEREPHEVFLSAFRIDRREVTVADYLRCVEAGRCAMPPYAEGGERFRKPELPVVLVTATDAERYCAFAGGRLPTEAEWERAARGREGRRYPWGNLFHPGLANHGASLPDRHDDRDGFFELAPVGSFPQGRTPDGIDDLAGNVAEWVADGFEDDENALHSAEKARNPLRRGTPWRVVRGGGFRSPPLMVRGASRHFVLASTRAPDIGFRCAYDARD